MLTAHSASPRLEKVTCDGVALGFSSFSTNFAAVSAGAVFLLPVFLVVGFVFREKSWKFPSSSISSSMTAELERPKRFELEAARK